MNSSRTLPTLALSAFVASPMASADIVVATLNSFREVPSVSSRADGRFEAVWTVDASAVRQATEVGRRLAAEHAPRLTLPEAPPPLPAVDGDATVRRATAITNRVIAHLDR